MLPCEALWLSSASEWDFVSRWETASVPGAAASLHDSLEYAQIGLKRWHWLSPRERVAHSLADASQRCISDPECEFAFAIKLMLDEGVVGFCYARRVWTGTICLEFLGEAAPPDVVGGGSLLMYLLAQAAGECRAAELWGECTKTSQGFYRRLKERLSKSMASEKRKPAQPSGAIAERFSFGAGELNHMRLALQHFRALTNTPSTATLRP